jgi:hypothetical protein
MSDAKHTGYQFARQSKDDVASASFTGVSSVVCSACVRCVAIARRGARGARGVANAHVVANAARVDALLHAAADDGRALALARAGARARGDDDDEGR